MSNEIKNQKSEKEILDTEIITGSAVIGSLVGGPTGAGIGAIIGGIVVIIKNLAESD